MVDALGFTTLQEDPWFTVQKMIYIWVCHIYVSLSKGIIDGAVLCDVL